MARKTTGKSRDDDALAVMERSALLGRVWVEFIFHYGCHRVALRYFLHNLWKSSHQLATSHGLRYGVQSAVGVLH